jgi:hypothetical protein
VTTGSSSLTSNSQATTLAKYRPIELPITIAEPGTTSRRYAHR